MGARFQLVSRGFTDACYNSASMIRVAALSTAVVAALALGACGSSSSDKKAGTGSTTGASAGSGSTGQAVPPINGKGGSPAKPGSTTPAKPPPVPANGETISAGNYYAFKAPSGQVGCAYTKGPTTLRCDVTFPTRFTRKPPHCEGDFGHAFLVSPSGHAGPICAGDTVLSASKVHTIPYGHSWTIGPYSCTSQTSSLTCVNGQGHGFRLSHSQQLIF
jgi:hypothetical protein